MSASRAAGFVTIVLVVALLATGSLARPEARRAFAVELEATEPVLLEPGTPVLFRGVRVGEVKDVAAAETKLRVSFQVQESFEVAPGSTAEYIGECIGPALALEKPGRYETAPRIRSVDL